MTPSTSVIIPCYNAERFLPEALESVRRQTVPVREIIVVDDGSTVPVRAPEGWDTPPLHLFRTSNRGQAAARNLAMAKAEGEFIAFLDADDMWHSRKVEEQEKMLRANPEAAGCYTRCADEPGFYGFGPYPPIDINDEEFLLMFWYFSFFPPSAFMVRRKVVEAAGSFREDLWGTGEDHELLLRFLACGRFLQVPEPLCYYRAHPNQFTTNTFRRLLKGKQARAAMIVLQGDRMVQVGVPRHKLWDPYRNDLLLAFYRRDFRSVRQPLWEFWKDHPGDWKLLIYWLVSCLPPGLVSSLRGRIEARPLSTNRAANVFDVEKNQWTAMVTQLRETLAR